jgi:hypothetical protein
VFYLLLKQYCLLIVSIVACMLIMSFHVTSGKGKLVIRFENYIGDKKLVLDTVSYVNSSGQSFSITNFKYYISHIRLIGKDGNTYSKEDGYYLIKQDEQSTWIAELGDVPAGSYDSINFMIGIDSLHNCSGAQSGALDPINGMFWTWNTGYIFMKLEGKSPASKSPGHTFEYHIGGYKAPTNFIRTAHVPVGKEAMNILPEKTTTLYLKTDAAEILNGPTKIDFAKLSSVTDFHNADMIADNYINMFSVIRFSNEW